MDQIKEGIESLRVAQSHVWAISRGNPSGSVKALLEKEIVQQILRAKKIKWMKEQEFKKYEVDNMLSELLHRLSRNSSDAPSCPTSEDDSSSRRPLPASSLASNV